MARTSLLKTGLKAVRRIAARTKMVRVIDEENIVIRHKPITLTPARIEYLTYSVEIYWADVELLAIKAAGNKSGKSKDGPLTVHITGRT